MPTITATPAPSRQAPPAAITSAPNLELRQSPQTDCDGAGVLRCPTGTCYTGANGFIGCCTVSNCVVRTTCIPYSSTASVDCNQDTGGCQRCTDPAAQECVTLTNTQMNQYALYCSTVSLFSELGYSNLISTGSMAPMPSSNPFTTTTSSSKSSSASSTSTISSSSTPHSKPTSTPSPSSTSETPIIVGVTVSCATLILILFLVGCVVHRKYVEIRRWPQFFCCGWGRKSGRRSPIEKEEFNHHRSLPLTDPSAVNSYRISEVHGDSIPERIAELGGDDAETDYRGSTNYSRGYAAVPTHSPHSSRTADTRSFLPWSPSTMGSNSTPQQSAGLEPPRLSAMGLSIRNPSPPSPPSPNLTMTSTYSTPEQSSAQPLYASSSSSPNRRIRASDAYGDSMPGHERVSSYDSYSGERLLRLSSGGGPGYITPENALSGLGLQTRHEYDDEADRDRHG